MAITDPTGLKTNLSTRSQEILQPVSNNDLFLLWSGLLLEYLAASTVNEAKIILLPK